MSFSSQENASGQPLDLENRLRGLILSNSTPVGVNNDSAPGASPAAASHIYRVPPHLMRATPEDQQEYVRQHIASSTPPTNDALNQQQQMQQQGGRKRPNQAQRRQMNSQLSVPIEARQTPQRPPASLGFSPATGFSANPRQYAPSASQNINPNYSQPYTPRSQNGPPATGPLPPIGYHQRGHQQTYQQSPHQNQNQYYGRPRQQDGPPGSFNASNVGSNPGNQMRAPAQQAFFQGGHSGRSQAQNRQPYQPGVYGGNNRGASVVNPDQLASQSAYLESLIHQRVPMVGIDDTEVAEKDKFRAMVEHACREAIAEHEKVGLGNNSFDPLSVELRCFGSMASGFATKASDMDLALLSPQSNPPPDSRESPIPRLLERKLLDAGFGARLLTRTRVPIIKLCQKPTSKLRTDLLEERLKWEDGFTATVEKNDGNAEEESQESMIKHEQTSEQGNQASTDAKMEASTSSFKVKMTELSQGSNSIGDYYGLAKKHLKDLGSEDIMKSDGSEDPSQVRILLDVCRRFVAGLSDDILKSRMQEHKSLDFDTIINPTAPRSLNGVYMQAEGERLVMAWDQRPFQETTEKWDNECISQITGWKVLCSKTNLETSMYNRLLHQALEKLKKIPSLQLMFLEQGLSEDPIQYHARVGRLLSELGGRDETDNGSPVLAMVITYYIGGVRNANIKAALQESTCKVTPQTLKSIGLQHRALQLAEDYEVAVNSKALFSESDTPYVTQYISLLRTGSTNQHGTIKSFDPENLIRLSLVSQTNIYKPLLQRIASLPDPTPASRRSRDRYSDHLEFPKTNIGIQCDINFSAQLALHNTLLLKCYSLTDPRVKPLILFVKHWAKRRAINTPYRGTLSSYGYVLMVLHYLTNIATPFVCPNLQHLRREAPSYLPPADVEAQTTCLGHDVQFWRNEKEIASLSERGLLNHNHDSIGSLARGFFEYYASTGFMSSGGGRGFEWGREVLSLRSSGGILSKQEKGWVGARTVTETTVEAAPALLVSPTIATAAVSINPSVPDPDVTEGLDSTGIAPIPATPTTPITPKKLARKEETKEIRHRYLFAIEDPFELDHNVARTVTHNGIVSIRDEFRRAWRIIRGVGARDGGGGMRNGPAGGYGNVGRGRNSANDGAKEEGLLDEVPPEKLRGLRDVMESIHGVFMEDALDPKSAMSQPSISQRNDSSTTTLGTAPVV
jgi:terminal uridylyltransferase